jgi:hypothetical protein
MKSMQSAVCMLAAIVGLCIAPVPAYAAEEEARVLILNGADPYLPAYLTMDHAMRARLAGEDARRFIYFSEPLDAQRFPMEAEAAPSSSPSDSTAAAPSSTTRRGNRTTS